MTSAFNNNLSSRRQAIIAESNVFLKALKSGASDKLLLAIIQRIREMEQQLARREGAVLDPMVWRIMYNRLKNRNVEFIDLDSY